MKKFIDDDRGYLDWIDRNPRGFVVNTYRNPSSKYLILHRATCGTISTSKRTIGRQEITSKYVHFAELNLKNGEKEK
ncbi:MAG TPA: hypothetical protein VMW40_08305 [Candidatus Bathyarchaeia archaeon]|nr:hypothetical protein [Candidatus Bathyarchaeia archaeon]